MSNYDDEADKLKAHLVELRRKHKILHDDIEENFKKFTVTEEIRRMKTQKLWLKDEIYRIEKRLLELGVYVNGYTRETT